MCAGEGERKRKRETHTHREREREQALDSLPSLPGIAMNLITWSRPTGCTNKQTNKKEPKGANEKKKGQERPRKANG